MNDRRSEQRYEINQPVLVTDLTRSEAAFPGLIVDISDRGLRLQIDRPLPLDTPLRVDVGDLMLLGEVCHCTAEGAVHTVGLELQHSLADLAEVARINDEFLGVSTTEPLHGRAKG